MAYSPNSTTYSFRVGGSGFTAFWWQGQVIGFAQSVTNQSPQPVAQPVAIQPLDAQRPLQIIVPAAIGPGTLQVQLFEMYNTKVWDSIMQITDSTSADGSAGVLTTYNDLAEVFLRLSALSQPISATRVIYPPNSGVYGGAATKYYADTYHNCIITDIRDDEQIQINSMAIVKNMTIQYTQVTRLSQTITGVSAGANLPGSSVAAST